MQVSLPDKAVHYGGTMRYRPFRPFRGRMEAERGGVHISVQASIAITRAAPVIEVLENEKAAEDDPRGRFVDIVV